MPADLPVVFLALPTLDNQNKEEGQTQEQMPEYDRYLIVPGRSSLYSKIIY